MTITFVNIWETKILDTIRSFLNAEFAGIITVYTGKFKDIGSQSIRLNPIGSNLVGLSIEAETREYILDVSYAFREDTIKKDTSGHILRQVSHIEALFHDNVIGSGNTFYDGRLVSCRINDKSEDENIDGLVVIRWEWRGLFTGNT